MVIILKGGGDYRGIGLVGVVYKVCTSTMNNRLQTSTLIHQPAQHIVNPQKGKEYRYSNHGGIDGQKSCGLCQEPLFQVFLDVQKPYNSLDRVG